MFGLFKGEKRIRQNQLARDLNPADINLEPRVFPLGQQVIGIQPRKITKFNQNSIF